MANLDRAGVHQFLTEAIRVRHRSIGAAITTGKYEKNDSRGVLTFMVEESLLPGGSAEGTREDEMKGHVG